MKKTQRGFALLVAIIFMSVMLSFGLALGSIGYKQQVLASAAVGSQYAFYAADAALECALYADQQLNLFDYATHTTGTPPPPPSLISSVACGDTSPSTQLSFLHDATQLVVKERLPLDGGKRCADVTIYKPAPGTGTTYLFSQGYDVSCTTMSNPPAGARFVSRGLNAHY